MTQILLAQSMHRPTEAEREQGIVMLWILGAVFLAMIGFAIIDAWRRHR